MFERYTESARRILFFARYEATQLGGLTIEPEHVLLGVLREAPQTIAQFAPSGAVESVRRTLTDAGLPQEKVSTSVEIPFSRDCKAVLEGALVEAEFLKNHWIGPAHLTLGIVAKTSGAAARALHAAGLDPDAMREFLRSTAPESEFVQRGTTAHPAPAVLRQWRGVVKPDRGDEYLAHLHRETLPSLSRLPGFVTLTIARREVEDGTEFQVVTLWRSLEDIKTFAGDDVTRAVVPPAAQALMVRCDERAVHYEIVSGRW